MNISPAVLPFVNACQISNRMANSPESPWPSLPAPPGAQNTWPVPLNRRSMFRWSLQAWMCNLCSQQSFQGRGSEVRKTTRYSVKGKKKDEMKIKIENMVRHYQTELNIRVGRHWKQNSYRPTHGIQRTQIACPLFSYLCTQRSTEAPLPRQTFTFLVCPLMILKLEDKLFSSFSNLDDYSYAFPKP